MFYSEAISYFGSMFYNYYFLSIFRDTLWHFHYVSDAPPDPNKGPAQQMRAAEKLGQPIPSLVPISDSHDHVLGMINLLIQWMTKYDPRTRVQLKMVQEALMILKE